MDRTKWLYSSVKRGCCIALTIIIVASCSSGGWYKFSSGEVREILPELSFLEASLALYNKPDSVRRASYEYFFRERGHTLSDWDSTMAWYAKYRVNEYEDFYRVASNVMEARVRDLEHREDSLRTLQTLLTNRRNGAIDSVNLLADSVAFYHYGSLVYRRFSLQPLQAYTDRDSFSLSTNVQGYEADGKRDSLRLSVYLAMKDSTIESFSKTIGSSGLHTLGFSVPRGKNVVSITGFIRGILPPKGRSPFVVIDSLSLVKYPRQTSEEALEADSLSVTSEDEGSAIEEVL